MHQASVGFHCPECTASGKQRVIRGPVTFEPVLTKVLIAVNVGASLLALAWGGSLGSLSGRALVELSLLAPFVDDGEIYRLVTSAVLHDGLLHLGFNLWALYVLGPPLERLFGRVRFGLLYGVSLLGGGFGVLLLSPLSPTVGASGAVFGLFGAIAVAQRSAGFSIWQSGLGPILGINLLLTFAVPQISIGGHLGGLIAGAAVAVVYVGAMRRRVPSWQPVAGALLMGAALFAGSLWAAAQWVDPLF